MDRDINRYINSGRERYLEKDRGRKREREREMERKRDK